MKAIALALIAMEILLTFFFKKIKRLKWKAGLAPKKQLNLK